MVSLPFLCS